MIRFSCVPLAVTMGDPAGIGPEICASALEPGRLPRCVTPILVGDGALIRSAAGPACPQLSPLPADADSATLAERRPYIHDVGAGGETIHPGSASAASGSASVLYLRSAIELVERGVAAGIVTAPISKEAWSLAGVGYAGHTEFLRDAAGVERTAMLFVGGGLRVALFTTHISIAQARAALDTKKLAGFIDFVVGELARFGMKGLRVAVAGLNPHAGEGGLFGKEDAEIIAPAIEICRNLGIDATGPLPADTLFAPPSRERYDLIIALYHDQGLIPVKALAFHEAVNITLGLPFVRTSPPHGVAYDIARTGKADPRGLVAAIETAAELLSRKGS